MDLSQLANDAITFLKPHLLATGGQLGDGVLATGVDGVGKVYQWLKSKLTRPTAAASLNQVTLDPTDEQNWEDLRKQLETLLKDASLRAELASMLPKTQTSAVTDQWMEQSGDRSAAAQVSGNRNSVNVNIIH